jgi:exopolysaccharide biosynthesis WecB/TagA/CpsF family protein
MRSSTSYGARHPARIDRRCHLALVPPPAGGPVCVILGIPFAAVSLEEAVARVQDMMRSGRPHQIVLANAHTMNCACADPQDHAILRRAALVLRDGAGLELAAMLRGRRLRHNFVGTDFVPALLARLAPGVRVYLYGAAPGVAAAAARALGARCPGIRIVGVEHGFAREGVADAVRAAAPDVLLVALGNPLQERWIDAHRDRLGVPVAIGVGALFDYLAGRVPRAPQWMRSLRAEWVFRLAIEPRRLWRRYLVGNGAFLWRVLRDGHGDGSAD